VAGEGRNLGTAIARVILNASGWTAGEKTVTVGAQRIKRDVEATASSVSSASNRMASGINIVAASFKKASDEAAKFNRSPLGQIQAGVKAVAKELQGLSIGAGLVVGGGVAAARSIHRTTVLFKTLIGSEERAQEEMVKLRDYAAETGQPFTSILEAALALTPSVRKSNLELSKVLSVANRLAILDPAQGFEGAAFALREAFSGDYLSLVKRFELSRKDLTKIFQKAGDDPEKIVEGLSGLIDNMGLTEDKVKAVGEAGVFAFERAAGAAKEALATAFMPLLTETIIPLLESFSTFLEQIRSTNPELLKMGAGVAVIVAALAPLLAAVSALIGLYKNLKVAAIAANAVMAKTGAGAALGKLGVGAAALTAGVVIGGEVTGTMAKAGAQGGDFDRIRKGEDPLAIAGERFKQVLVIALDGLVKLAKVFIQAGAFIANAVDQILNVFKLAGSVVTEFVARLKMAIGDLVFGIGEALSGLFDTTGIKTAGSNLYASASQQFQENEALQRQLEERIKQGFSVPPDVMASIDKTFSDIEQSLVGGFYNFLFPVEQAASEVAAGLEAAADKIAGFTPEFSSSQVDAFREYQDDLGTIAEEAEQERLDAADEYENEKTELEKDHAEQRKEIIDDFAAKRLEQERKLAEDTAKAQLDAARADAEALIKLEESIGQARTEFLRREAEEEARWRLEEKQRRRKHRMELLELAADLDAFGIWQERRKFKEESRTRNENQALDQQLQDQNLIDRIADLQLGYEQEKALRDQQLAQRIMDMQVQFEAERALMNAAEVQELADLAVKQQAERDLLAAEHEKRLEQITAQEEAERLRREEEFKKTFDALVEQEDLHQDMMLDTQRKGQAEMENELLLWWQSQKQIAAGAAAEAAALATAQAIQAAQAVLTNFTKTPINPYGPFAPKGPSPTMPGPPKGQFPSGLPLVMKTGFVGVEQGEAILRRDQVRMIARATGGGAASTTRMAGVLAGENSGGLTIDSFSPMFNFDNMGTMTPDRVERIVRRVLLQTLEEFAQ
jgi:hypothetical protein